MIVGFLIGLIASAISNRNVWLYYNLVGWLGAFTGQLLNKSMLANTAIVPGTGKRYLIGALLES